MKGLGKSLRRSCVGFENSSGESEQTVTTRGTHERIKSFDLFTFEKRNRFIFTQEPETTT